MPGGVGGARASLAPTRFGGRPAETEQPKGRHRAAGRPYLGQRAVDQVRREEWNAHDRSHTKAGKWIKGTRWSLLKSPAKQTMDQLAKLGEVQQANRPLYRAFLLKEELRLLYQLEDPRPRARASRQLADLGFTVPIGAVHKARPHHPPPPRRDPRRHPTRTQQRAPRRPQQPHPPHQPPQLRLPLSRPLIALVYLCCAGITIELPR